MATQTPLRPWRRFDSTSFLPSFFFFYFFTVRFVYRHVGLSYANWISCRGDGPLWSEAGFAYVRSMLNATLQTMALPPVRAGQKSFCCLPAHKYQAGNLPLPGVAVALSRSSPGSVAGVSLTPAAEEHWTPTRLARAMESVGQSRMLGPRRAVTGRAVEEGQTD